MTRSDDTLVKAEITCIAIFRTCPDMIHDLPSHSDLKAESFFLCYQHITFALQTTPSSYYFSHTVEKVNCEFVHIEL